MRRTPRALAAATLALVAATALAACSSEDSPGPDATDGTTSAPAPAGSGPEGPGGGSADGATTTSSTPVPGPEGAPVEVPAPVAERWRELGGEAGALGRAAGPASAVAGGSVTDFERGSIVLTPAGRAFVVQGEILTTYRDEGGPEGALGFPTSDETTTDGGWISVFEHGTIAFLDGRPVVETR